MKSFVLAFCIGLFCCCLILPDSLSAQESLPIQLPDTLNSKRLTALTVTTATIYAGSLTGLYYLWYRNYPQSHFHFYNDTHDWMMMDKMGHLTTAYQLGYYGYQSLRWTGLDDTRSTWIGGSLGLVFLTSVELMDGFSSEWGFSLGDMAANTLGSALFISQQLIWKEQRIRMKFSFSQSKYARYRPSLLGTNLGEQIIKDYNGQTYWASFNIKSFLKPDAVFPAWLNIAWGYGIKGTIGSSSNPEFVDGQPIPHFLRTKQYYLSPDIDLTRIKTNSKTIKITLGLLNFIKIPLPTIEYNGRDGFRLHLVHF